VNGAASRCALGPARVSCPKPKALSLIGFFARRAYTPRTRFDPESNSKAPQINFGIQNVAPLAT
jgi:hypothetical protein